MRKKKQEADSSLTSPILRHYEIMVGEGSIKDDAAQRKIISRLESLLVVLSEPKVSLAKLFRRDTADVKKMNLYIWGDVGRGKSMLMDLFFDAAPVENKRRVHFHAFMQEVHARLHNYRTDGIRGKSGADPVVLVARDIAKETQLLCFDELQANDVADATLLFRLFEGLFAAGVVIVSTSNHPPESLYTGGIQRERFQKFIELIKAHMEVASLTSPSDYRYLQLKGSDEVYHVIKEDNSEVFLDQILKKLEVLEIPKHDMFLVQGRSIPFLLYGDNIGRFSFDFLCGSALGAADYITIANRLETVIVTDIPKLPPEKRNEAKRFVTFVDSLYERRTRLICTAEVPPEQIYESGDGSFEFARTISRLVEMQSDKYLQGIRE